MEEASVRTISTDPSPDSATAEPDALPTQETATPQTPAPDTEQPAAVMPDASPDDLRAEIRRLRDETAETRVKGRRADTLATRLVEAYAGATGLLVDASDLRADLATLLDDDGVPDPAKVREAVRGVDRSEAPFGQPYAPR